MTRWVATYLDTTWKRVLAAAALSAVIVLAVTTFASSSYVQTQKVQLESSQGDRCLKWQYSRQDDTTVVTCAKWRNS